MSEYTFWTPHEYSLKIIIKMYDICCYWVEMVEKGWLDVNFMTASSVLVKLI